jgi:hypothetical protein
MSSTMLSSCKEEATSSVKTTVAEAVTVMETTKSALLSAAAETEKTAAPNVGDTVIYELRPSDVLLGRGSRTDQYPGNMVYRALVSSCKAAYRSATANPETKRALAEHILAQVQQKHGRFLRRIEPNSNEAIALGIDNSSSNKNKQHAWVEIDAHAAMEKTKQALREKGNVSRQRLAMRTTNTPTAVATAVTSTTGTTTIRAGGTGHSDAVGNGSSESTHPVGGSAPNATVHFPLLLSNLWAALPNPGNGTVSQLPPMGMPLTMVASQQQPDAARVAPTTDSILVANGLTAGLTAAPALPSLPLSRLLQLLQQQQQQQQQLERDALQRRLDQQLWLLARQRQQQQQQPPTMPMHRLNLGPGLQSQSLTNHGALWASGGRASVSCNTTPMRAALLMNSAAASVPSTNTSTLASTEAALIALLQRQNGVHTNQRLGTTGSEARLAAPTGSNPSTVPPTNAQPYHRHG